MDFESLRESMENAGVRIFVKSHIELKCFRMEVCYEKHPLLQGKTYLLKAFQTLWKTLEVPHDQQEHMAESYQTTILKYLCSICP